MIKKISFLFILLNFFGLSFMEAQITATPSAGCAPLAVSFTGVAGASNILWDFKDGNSSPAPNPTNTYVTPGTYNVHYTATVGGSPVSFFTTVTVYSNPTPLFTAAPPTSGCIPLTVSFTSTSTGGGGSAISTYSWTFGDGGLSSANNPTYTYTLPGQFDVQLKVTDANGCSASLKLTKLINTSQKPTPVIHSNPAVTTSCTAPFIVTFNGTASTTNSTTGAGLTYSWTFSNGNTSTLATPPAQTFTLIGNSPVTLTVTDNNGCSNSTSQNVHIGNPTATFVVKDSVCNPVTFNALGSTGTLSWDYGDSQTGISSSHTYSASGTYIVKLHVVQGSCFKDTTRTIYVEIPHASFTMAPTYSCSVPEVVNFTNTSTGTVTHTSYSWIFNSNTTKYNIAPLTSHSLNPSVTVTDLDTNRFTIDRQDVLLNAYLLVITPAGCRDSVTRKIVDTLFIPTARIQPDKARGCAPLAVAFSDSSVSKEPIVSWQYIWGDGTPNVTASSSGVVNHTYTTPGVYQAKLVIVNSRGCVDTSYVIVIYVGAPPTPNFTFSPTPVCPNKPVVFTDQSTAAPGSPIDTWHYFTDGHIFMSSCYTDPNPTYSFTNTVGAQNITLVTCSRGCCDSIVKPNAITVLGPIVKYSTQMSCNAPDAFTFNGDIKGADTWTWNFGDGTVIPGSTLNTISHTYISTGNYLTSIIGHSNSSGCPDDTFKVKIYDKHIKAMLTSDTSTCISSSKVFDASTSVDVNTGAANGYVWLWGDNTHPDISNSPLISHSYLTPGFYHVKLIVIDINGCRDTAVSKKIKVSDVTAKFKPDHHNGCIPWKANFTDQSISDTTLTSWSWSFGDGSPAGSGKTTSHTYVVNQAFFVVTLTATNILGCTKTFTDTLVPSNPIANFTAVSTKKCAGDSIKFNPQILIQKNYSWTFGDGGSSTVISPWHKYLASGTYTVSLMVTDSIGCLKTLTQNNYISIQDYPHVAFSSNLDSAANRCAPVVGQFTDSSTVSIFGSRSWNLGTGGPVVSSSSVSTPYQFPGSYSVTLIETTTFGCKDSLRKTYYIQQPKADFTLSPSPICKGDQVTFNLIPSDTSDFYSYHWYFGDGHDTVGISPMSHYFNFHPAGGTANVTLMFWGSGHSCKTAVQHPVNIHQVIANFNRNNELTKLDTVHCLGSTDLFTNTSLAATSWNWSFGDGGVSAQLSPTHKYLNPGKYWVTLDIKDAVTTCVDTLKKLMIVNPIPHLTARGGDTCLGKPITLSSLTGAGNSYSWSPSTGLSSTNIPNPVATPTVTTTYTVTVLDSNGCKNDTAVTLYVMQPIPQVIYDTAIIIGQSVQLFFLINPSNLYTYTWTPTDSLSCKTCPNPIANPLVTTTYTLTVSDKKGCFTSSSTYDVKILPETSIDVPTAFTPNGDGTNDIVFVKGWGIKKLLEFDIYNRWGELVFTTDDINVGWDGYYKGVLQNVETYAWTAKAETWVQGKVIVRKGFIKLLR
jgi:gliding motility-associated-like protein